MLKSIGQVANYKPLSACGMEELAAHQSTIAPSGGILFARKVDGDRKVEARQLVLDLFGRKQWDRRLNMLTMPGVHWRFERKLLADREPSWTKRPYPSRTHFTGMENDRAIYFAAAAQMPGVETPNALIKLVKPGRLPFAEIAIKTRFASFFFADADDVMKHEWKAPAYRQQEMAGWDAAWLDYTGPLTVERMKVIERFYSLHVREILIVTALKARWNRQTSAAVESAGGHEAWIRQRLPGEVLHSVEYFDTSPMAQFAVRKSEKQTQI